MTVAVCPRERFAPAADMLRTLCRNTSRPFQLIVMDCNTPQRYLRDMQEAVRDHPDVSWVRSEEFLLPTQCKNLMVPQATGDYVCFLENDCRVQPGWLEALLAALRDMNADVAVPKVIEGRLWWRKVHGDRDCGSLASEQAEDGSRRYRFSPAPEPGRWDFDGPRRVARSVEQHAMLFTRDALARFLPFDENYNCRWHYDLSLSLLDKGLRVVEEPAARVLFDHPQGLEKDERPYFHWVWDVEAAHRAEVYLREKWPNANIAAGMDWVRGQHFRTSFLRWRWFCFRNRLRSWGLLPGATS